MTLLIRDTCIGYPKRPVLLDLQLPPVEPGSLVAVLGPNGVGKSTLLKGLAGLLPCRGTQMLQGESLAALPQWRRNQMIGYLPQSLPQATSLIVYESLYAACRIALAQLDAAGIEQRIEQVVGMLGLQHIALRRLSELSGGQRQMVGLAQVLVRQPPLMLLDEPTSALDLRWQLTVLERVRTITRETGAIALVASHDLNLALRFCDQVLLMGFGGVSEMGLPATVLTSANLAQAYAVATRVERCSQGFTLVLADKPLAETSGFSPPLHTSSRGAMHDQ